MGLDMKKIAIDATILSPTGSGLNRYTSELLKELMKREGEFITYTTMPEVREQYGEKVMLVPEVLSEYGFRGNLLRLLWHQFNLTVSILKEKASLFYSPIPEGMLFPVCPQIITVHDVIPLLFPESMPRLKYYHQWILPNLLRVSGAVIVTSESTKKDVQKYYNISDKPLHVVYQGYREDVFYPSPSQEVQKAKYKYNLQDFILCVGETRPYKNMRRLVEAFARAGVPSLELAIVGRINRLDQELVNLPQHLGIEGKVKFLGYVPDDDLAGLYGGAKTFVFPSLYEGFGIPPLEAMACGCPVVVSKAASLPEVCGDAAYYVDPYNVDSIAEGIFKVSNDETLRTSLKEKGLERVKLFSYRKAADEIIKIFNALV